MWEQRVPDLNHTVLFVANRGYALSSSRKELIERFLAGGWRVVLATADDREARGLASLGAELEPVSFSRGGVSVRVDWQAWRRLRAINRRWRPVLVHHFHAKPIILGSVAARTALGPHVRVVNTITGLGHAFVRGGVTERLAGLGYGAALARSDITIFQNRDDSKLFRDRGWVEGRRARLIPGAGIDLDRFATADRGGRPRESPTVVMLGRLLYRKGIPEFVEVAGRIRERWPAARFLLAGEEDPGHPDAVTADWLRRQKAVEYLGRLEDVGPLLARADLLLFPSYYREGVPRAIMEAAATGLPTVAFDVPGVREAVCDGETGRLVPARDVDALTVGVEELLADPDRRHVLGRGARELAESAFDIRAIHAAYLDVYRELGMAM